MTADRHAHRGTIHVETAEIITHTSHPGDQFILRVQAPECARRAVPGSFAHIRCDPDIPMRRPVSIMSTDPASDHVDFLYKPVGPGLRALTDKQPGDTINMMGPIGNGFSLDPARPRKLLIGGGVGAPPMMFLADHLAGSGENISDSLVLLGSEVPFPMVTGPSQLTVSGLPADATHGVDSLDALGIPSRLASQQNYPGMHSGYVTDLARLWLAALSEPERAQVEIFACGPEPMLQAAAALAADYALPCQLCLEEFMACAVGGCAGCTVPVHLPDGIAMQRVCVDGPVFAAATIYPPNSCSN